MLSPLSISLNWQEVVVALLLLFCVVKIGTNIWHAVRAKHDDGCATCPCGCGKKIPRKAKSTDCDACSDEETKRSGAEKREK